MRFNKMSQWGVCMILPFLFWIASGAAAYAQNPSLKPVAVGTLMVNTPFWVEVRVGDPNTVTNLYGLNLSLRSSVPTVTYVDGSAVKGDFLGASPLTFFQRADAQTVDMTVSKTAAPGVSGSGMVAKAQFISSAGGSISFTLKNITGNDPSGGAIAFDAAVGNAEVTTSVPLDGEETPRNFELYNNYPNPFNPETVIRYAVPFRTKIVVQVFDGLGRKVADLVDGEVEAGVYEVPFNGSGLSSGVYFCRLQADAQTKVSRIVLNR